MNLKRNNHVCRYNLPPPNPKNNPMNLEKPREKCESESEASKKKRKEMEEEKKRKRSLIRSIF